MGQVRRFSLGTDVSKIVEAERRQQFRVNNQNRKCDPYFLTKSESCYPIRSKLVCVRYWGTYPPRILVIGSRSRIAHRAALESRRFVCVICPCDCSRKIDVSCWLALSVSRPPGRTISRSPATTVLSLSASLRRRVRHCVQKVLR